MRSVASAAVSWMLLALGGSAAAAEPAGEINLRIHSAGVSRYSPGKWAVVGVRGVNPTSSDAWATVSVFLERNSDTQFTRRLWLPAGTVRRSWLPIRIPESLPPDARSVSASAVVLLESRDGQMLTRGSDQTLVTEIPLSLNQSSIQTGTIYRHPRFDAPPSDEDIDWDAYEMLVMTREAAEADRTTIDLADAFLPPYIEAYEGLDQLLICSDRWLEDSAGAMALRGWVARGGRVWVMLDRATMASVRALLGNATCCEIVDRVELASFQLETPDQKLVGGDALERWESERPVDFLRVFVTDAAQVYSRIDGWPAAFSVPLGTGEVFVTTLSARGWRYEFQPFAESSGLPTSGPTNALRHLTGQFQVQQPRPPLAPQDVRPMLEAQIGYQIPSRRLVGLILGTNCVLLLFAGAMFAWCQRLEQLAWVVPTLAVMTTALMMAVARGHTARVPPTAAAIRLVDVVPAANEAHARTLVTLYSPDSVELPLPTDSLSAALPDLRDLRGAMKHAEWGDRGEARWRGVSVAAGSTRLIEIDDHFTLGERLYVRGQFGSRGFEGQLHGSAITVQTDDAIVAAPPAPSVPVQFLADHRFICREGMELAPHEYLRGVLLSDEQQRRQVFYRQLLMQRNDRLYPRQPTLFVWSDGWQTGAQLPDGFARRGSTLWAIPLEIERSPPGTRVVVPATFISMRNAGGRLGGSGAYNPRTGEWMRDVSMSTDSTFRFVLPQQVLPCRIDQATISLKVHAPSRTVTLFGMAHGEKAIVDSRQNPSGVVQVVVKDPSLLQPDEHGGLLFGVAVADMEGQAEGAAPQRPPRGATDRFEQSTWQIDYLRVSVAGETL